MKDASCARVRVCVRMQNSHVVNEFINKGIDSIGLRTEIAVKGSRRR